jgi:hypothetical protein
MAAVQPSAPPASPVRCALLAIFPDGRLQVEAAPGEPWLCDWLDTGSSLSPALAVGDTLLVLPPSLDASGVVLGRIGSYQAQRAAVVLNATESLSLRCGESSLEMRADGQVLLRGEDVLLRAKGTQRIRAGTVAIN